MAGLLIDECLDESERQCLFNLVAESCINKRIQESIAVDCYRIEELRNSAFQPVKSRACIGSADFDAFRDEASAIPEGAAILERLPTPRHKSLTNGLAFAMQCKGTKTILTFHFAKDFVRSAIETLIVDAPNILPQSLL